MKPDVLLQKKGTLVVKQVVERVVLDLDQDAVLTIEIIGYSHIAGPGWNLKDFEWLEPDVVSISGNEDDDVLFIRLATGANTGQRTADAVFGFDKDGALVHILIA